MVTVSSDSPRLCERAQTTWLCSASLGHNGIWLVCWWETSGWRTAATLSLLLERSFAACVHACPVSPRWFLPVLPQALDGYIRWQTAAGSQRKICSCDVIVMHWRHGFMGLQIALRACVAFCLAHTLSLCHFTSVRTWLLKGTRLCAQTLCNHANRLLDIADKTKRDWAGEWRRIWPWFRNVKHSYWGNQRSLND